MHGIFKDEQRIAEDFSSSPIGFGQKPLSQRRSRLKVRRTSCASAPRDTGFCPKS